MMNIVQTQDQLKNFSQEQLIKEMQMPSGTAPQFLILNEIMRRQKMQQDFAAQQGGAPQTTVAEDAIAAAGVPQEGLASMAQALAPQTDMMQNTGVGAVQQMYGGGPVKKMAEGDVVVRDGLQYVEGSDGQLYPQGEVGGLAAVERTRPNLNFAGDLSSRAVDSPPTPSLADRIPAPEVAPEPRLRPGEVLTGGGLPMGQDTGTPLSIPEDGIETLLPPAVPPTSEVPVAPQGGGAGGAGGMSSFEQELMDTLARREEAAEQDKWLALAQVGLNMMSSTQPTLLGAVGEAGLQGVEAARGARDTYDKDKLEILGAMEQSRMARAAAAASAAKRAQGEGLTAYQAATLGRGARNDLFDRLQWLTETRAGLAPGGVPMPETQDEFDLRTAQIELLERELGLRAPAPSAPATDVRTQ